MNSLTLLIIALCFFALAYRYYSAFLAAKVAVIDASRPTPAHRLHDGRDYHPTNRIVLFGHHFAAIAGAGPLIGPVLAVQYGYLPGALWILIGAVFAGGVHDFIILFASVRQNGESLSKIAARHVGPVSGVCAMIAIFFIITVALAGLSLAVVNALRESSWGVFTIACSIPIALLMGQWMYKIRPGKVAEASLIGVVLLLAALFLGQPLATSRAAHLFTYSEATLKLLLPAYGFVAAYLPVWMLLCPRDYLSSYLKLGVVALLALGIFIVHPALQARPLTEYISGGGPIVPGPVWPYVCLTIACGAISGFHGLISSGTTPKMINSEADIRPIGYGAMLCEGFVAIMALVAAGVLVRGDYFAINVPQAAWAKFGIVPVNLNELSSLAGENLAGRTGGAVSLAAGMSYIFGNIPGMRPLMAVWYHFAIVFEALFILTTVDTGTRVARFILQEIGASAPERLRRSSARAAIPFVACAVLACVYLVSRGVPSGPDLWPVLSLAGQLLLGLGLAELTSLALRSRAHRVALVGVLLFLLAGASIFVRGLPYLINVCVPSEMTTSALFIMVILLLAAVMVVEFCFRWTKALFLADQRALDTIPVGALFASGLVVLAWGYLLSQGTISTIWPMFGVANQLLATLALAVGTTLLLRSRVRRYALVTFLPLLFMVATVFTGGVENLLNIYVPKGMIVSTILTTVMLVLAAVIIAESLGRWGRILVGREGPVATAPEAINPGETESTT